MAKEILAKSGLYFDELNKIRVCEPKTCQDSGDLKQECTEFVSKLSTFQQQVDAFIGLIETLSKQVDEEKLKAIGSRNLLQSVTQQKETEKQQIHALIQEKQIELERLRLQYESLQRQEQEQRELMQQFHSEH